MTREEIQQKALEATKTIQGVMQEVIDCDNQYNMHIGQDLIDLMYMTLCMVGEAGEVANIVKKIYRDGDTPERRAHLHEEIVDVQIYICELILATGMDFDEAWKLKHDELHKRWQKRLEEVGK